jgi:hypothetical protein
MICPPLSDFTGPRQSFSLGGRQKAKWLWCADRISKALIVGTEADVYLRCMLGV